MTKDVIYIVININNILTVKITEYILSLNKFNEIY
jgi:hypothetical protein